MKIEFSRTGGVAGMRLATSVKTEELPAGQGSTIEKLVNDAGFFDLPEQIMPPVPKPDRFEYRLTISNEKDSHSIAVSDAAVPDRLRPLLDYLTTMAVKGRKG